MTDGDGDVHRLGQRHQELVLLLDEMQRRAPRRTRAEARQLGEKLDQALDLGAGDAAGHSREGMECRGNPVKHSARSAPVQPLAGTSARIGERLGDGSHARLFEFVAVLLRGRADDDRRGGEARRAGHRQRQIRAPAGPAEGGRRRAHLCRDPQGPGLRRGHAEDRPDAGRDRRGLRRLPRPDRARRHGRLRLFRPWLERRHAELPGRGRRAGRRPPGVPRAHLDSAAQRRQRHPRRHRPARRRAEGGDHRRLPRQPVRRAGGHAERRPEPRPGADRAAERHLRRLLRRHQPGGARPAVGRATPIRTASSRASSRR